MDRADCAVRTDASRVVACTQCPPRSSVGGHQPTSRLRSLVPRRLLAACRSHPARTGFVQVRRPSRLTGEVAAVVTTSLASAADESAGRGCASAIETRSVGSPSFAGFPAGPLGPHSAARWGEGPTIPALRRLRPCPYLVVSCQASKSASCESCLTLARLQLHGYSTQHLVDIFRMSTSCKAIEDDPQNMRTHCCSFCDANGQARLVVRSTRSCERVGGRRSRSLPAPGGRSS